MKTPIPPPRRILIVRLSAIGDVVFASPLVGALRRSYPEAQISWLVEPVAAPLLEANPELREVIRWPRGEWQQLARERRYLALLREVRRFRRVLRERRFDLVLDVQGLTKSAFLSWLTGAPRRIGLASAEPTRLFLTETHAKVISPRIGSEYLGIAEELGLDPGDFRMDIALTDADRGFAAALSHAGPYTVIAPFTTRPQKHWVDAHWRALAQALAARGQRVVMLGGPGDVAAAASLAAGSAIDNQVGGTTLSQSAAVIAGAAALVGVDTGLTHMGIAFGVPTVALFGSTCPYLDTTRDNARVIYHALDCAPCRRNPTCNGRFDCLVGITPDEVLATLDAVTAC